MRPSNVGRLSGYRRDAAAHGGRRERKRLPVLKMHPGRRLWYSSNLDGHAV